MDPIIEVKPTPQQKKIFYSTMQKLQKSQKLKEQLLPYLEANYPHLLVNNARRQRIKECCNVVSFRRYLDSGNVQLSSASFCKYDRICIACATKRAMRMIKRFAQGVQNNNLHHKQRYYIVLTISHKAWDELQTLLDRLQHYKNKLARAYRNGKRPNQKNKSFFSQFDGMVMSIEVSHQWSNGWHPHINILACTDNNIQIDQKYCRWQTNENLLQERKQITWGTSYIHNIRKIDVSKNHFTRSGIWEVFKYAIKFSDLTVEQLAEVMNIQVINKYRFFATYGIFRGWKIEHSNKEKGKWSEGLFLYNENSAEYVIDDMVRT